MSPTVAAVMSVTHDSNTGSGCVYSPQTPYNKTKTFINKISFAAHQHTAYQSRLVKTYKQKWWSFSKTTLASYELFDNLDATMTGICCRKHRIVFIGASIYNQNFYPNWIRKKVILDRYLYLILDKHFNIGWISTRHWMPSAWLPLQSYMIAIWYQFSISHPGTFWY